MSFIITLLVNLIFGWLLYLYGWNSSGYLAMLIDLLLGFSIFVCLTFLNWLSWNPELAKQFLSSKQEIVDFEALRQKNTFSVIMNAAFTLGLYLFGWYKFTSLPIIFLSAFLITLLNGLLWSPNFNRRGLEKRKRGLSDDSLRNQLSDEAVYDEALDDYQTDSEDEVLRESR